ncbi:MAG: hypothetical protein ACK4WH_03475 [Phycisphaerales bacterium]
MRQMVFTVVGLVAVGCVLADEKPTVAWSSSGGSSPRYSLWEGGLWSSAALASSVGAVPQWVVARECPTRSELAVVTLDSQKDVNVVRFDGATWSAAEELCTDTDGNSTRCYDAAYEQASGRLLVAYWSKSHRKVAFRTSSGGAFSEEGTIAFPLSARVRTLKLVPKPSSDEIVMLVVGDDSRLCAAVWNGASWNSPANLESKVQTTECECFSFCFESASGDGLIVYAEKNKNAPRYRTLVSGSWSEELSLPSVGGRPCWIRLAPEPGSDRVVFACLDRSSDVNTCIWNGSAWASAVEHEKSAESRDRRGLDVCFDSTGAVCLLAYTQKGKSSIRYRTLTGSTWSSEGIGPTAGNRLGIVQIVAEQGSNRLHVVCSDTSARLHLMSWNGLTLTHHATPESALGGGVKRESFMLAAPCDATTRKRVVRWRHVAPE